MKLPLLRETSGFEANGDFSLCLFGLLRSGGDRNSRRYGTRWGGLPLGEKSVEEVVAAFFFRGLTR